MFILFSYCPFDFMVYIVVVVFVDLLLLQLFLL